MWKKVWVLFFSILAIASGVQALERFEVITTEELEQLLAKRQAGAADFVLVNTLDEIIFRHNAIPSSINIPWCRVDEVIHLLGDNKDKLIVAY
jgi:hypothetical protein